MQNSLKPEYLDAAMNTINLRVSGIVYADGPAFGAENAVSIVFEDAAGTKSYLALHGLPLDVAEVLVDGLRAAAKVSRVAR